MKKITHTEKFTNIYEKELWGKGKGSGTGSSASYCQKFIHYMNGLIKEKNPASVLDLGCGDWQYTKYVKYPSGYVGVDAVGSVIEGLKSRHGKEGREFIKADFQNTDNIKEIFAGRSFDIVVIKDVLMHWTDEEITTFMDCFMELPWKTLITVNAWKFNRDPSKNINYVRDPSSNTYNWAPIDINDSVLTKYGFEDVLRYPKFNLKQVGRIDK